MDQSRIDKSLQEFEITVNEIIGKYAVYPLAPPGTVQYMIEKVKKFSDNVQPYADDLNTAANKILTNFKEVIAGEKEMLRDKLVEAGKAAFIKYKTQNWN